MAFDTVGAAQHVVEQPQFSVVVHGRRARVRSGVPFVHHNAAPYPARLSPSGSKGQLGSHRRLESEAAAVTKKAHGEIVEQSGRAGHQGGGVSRCPGDRPYDYGFGCRQPRRLQPMTVEPIEPVMRVWAFGSPSRRSRRSTCPSTCGHLAEYCPVGCTRGEVFEAVLRSPGSADWDITALCWRRAAGGDVDFGLSRSCRGERPESPWSRESPGDASGWRCRDRKDRR